MTMPGEEIEPDVAPDGAPSDPDVLAASVGPDETAGPEAQLEAFGEADGAPALAEAPDADRADDADRAPDAPARQPGAATAVDGAGDDELDVVAPRSRAAAAADDATLVAPPTPRAVRHVAVAEDERPVAVRLAHLHLRLGSLALARAELESLAGRGMLDEESLLDLAEVRWRTGDLAGAGEAADALVSRGQGGGLALVIAAESVAAQGRPGEARRLAARALEAVPGPLDVVFAGIPRSLIWPADVLVETGAAPLTVDPPPAVRPSTNAGHAAATVRGASIAELAPDPASPAAAEAYAGGRAALGAGETTQAAIRLGVALRLEPAYAHDVLEAIGDLADEPALALVAGDALRLLGRESEARAAFDVARGRPQGAGDDHASTGEGGAGPG